eukprot:CAMPEP_0172397084 /NCGR_PEP_ID=MMETSP1061-20121228/28863_1 /TAXON_ID=37318 /ORGANISM="Pseudo-nitzschia pungens, Strain cf. pungens" /LENGTH=149 /DNA_ID=CAMNT_0013129153 /DNA_START=85 /DNA_END=534 /DNA_ORIENTATION=+
MMTLQRLSILLAFFAVSSTEAFTTSSASMQAARTNTQLSATSNEDIVSSRRNMFKRAGAFAAVVAFTPVVAANALDMDAFANAQIEADIKNCDPKRDPKCIPKLNADEALCKYGQSGSARGDACKRVKAAGGDISQKPQGQSLGGAYAM